MYFWGMLAMACLPYARHSALLHTRLIFFGTIRANTLWIHFPVASPRDLRNEARLALWCNYARGLLPSLLLHAIRLRIFLIRPGLTE